MPNDNRHYHFLHMVDNFPSTRHLVRGQLSIFVGQEPIFGPDSNVWHLVIGHPKRVPTLEEVKMACDELTPPDVVMMLMFPPRAQYDKVHPRNTFNLYEYLPDPRLVMNP